MSGFCALFLFFNIIASRLERAFEILSTPNINFGQNFTILIYEREQFFCTAIEYFPYFPKNKNNVYLFTVLYNISLICNSNDKTNIFKVI